MHLSFASSSTLPNKSRLGLPQTSTSRPRPVDGLPPAARPDRLVTTRVNLLGNKLVFIATTDRSVKIDVQSSFDLSDAFEGRIALGDPSHVLGWHLCAPGSLGALAGGTTKRSPRAFGRRAIGPELRRARRMRHRHRLRNGCHDFGRGADHRTSTHSLHAPIRYPAAIVAGRDRPAVRRIFAQIRSDSAQTLFSRHGFTTLQEEAPRAQP